MAFRTVLSVIGTNSSDDDLNLAIDLCQRENAHLAVQIIAVAVPPPASPYTAVSTAAWLEECRYSMDRMNEREKEVNELVAKAGISADVSPDYLDRISIDDVVGTRARYADIALLGPDLLADDTIRAAVLKGLFYVGQIPVLLVPEGRTATLRPKRVLLAWDGGLEASRAAHEALPLLTETEEVHITLVDPRDPGGERRMEPGADIAAYLARHGVATVVDRLPSGGRPTAEVLQDHATDMAADMIVIGAYGHSRLRDLIFGGVTRTMLTDSKLPVFMAR